VTTGGESVDVVSESRGPSVALLELQGDPRGPVPLRSAAGLLKIPKKMGLNVNGVCFRHVKA